MPELPEVQAVVDGLRTTIPGKTIAGVSVRRTDIARPSGAAVRRALAGSRLKGVRRRAKNILVETDRDVVLRVHLGMTGQLLYYTGGAPPRTGYTAVGLRFTDGSGLVYSDVRRFGVVEVLTRSAWHEREKTLGPEPLDPELDSARFGEALRSSRSPIRSWLLDPRRIAGIGNIYAVEALFGARIHPTRPASSLDSGEAASLLAELRRALKSAIQAGGTTLQDYRNIDGQEGENAKNLRAYGREGAACKRCGTAIQRLVFGGRSAFLCPRCQPEPN